MAHAGDLLVVLVALAGDQHHFIGAGHQDRLPDRGGAVALHLHAGGIGEPAKDVGDDRLAILRRADRRCCLAAGWGK